MDLKGLRELARYYERMGWPGIVLRTSDLIRVLDRLQELEALQVAKSPGAREERAMIEK